MKGKWLIFALASSIFLLTSNSDNPLGSNPLKNKKKAAKKSKRKSSTTISEKMFRKKSKKLNNMNNYLNFLVRKVETGEYSIEKARKLYNERYNKN